MVNNDSILPLPWRKRVSSPRFPLTMSVRRADWLRGIATALAIDAAMLTVPDGQAPHGFGYYAAVVLVLLGVRFGLRALVMFAVACAPVVVLGIVSASTCPPSTDSCALAVVGPVFILGFFSAPALAGAFAGKAVSAAYRRIANGRDGKRPPRAECQIRIGRSVAVALVAALAGFVAFTAVPRYGAPLFLPLFGACVAFALAPSLRRAQPTTRLRGATNLPFPLRLRPQSRPRFLALCALCTGIVVLGGNLAAANALCDSKSGCARPGSQRRWQGRVFTKTGAPAAGARVYYYFVSSGVEEADPVSITTDQEGRYCLLWPGQEAGIPAVFTITRGSSRPAIARFAALARTVDGPIIVSPDGANLSGGTGNAYWNGLTGGFTDTGWDAKTDTAPHCAAAAPPWYRVTNLATNWRSQLLTWGALAVSALALLSLASFPRRSRIAAGAPALASALAGALTILFILVWTTHSI